MAGRAFSYPSEEEQEQYLALRAKGKIHEEAARESGSTGTQFRRLKNSKSDEGVAFRARLIEILGDESRPRRELTPDMERLSELEALDFIGRIREEAVLRALDPERGRSGASNRMLYNWLLLKLDEFKPLLEARTRHIHEGAVGVYALPQIDTDRWTIEQHQEFMALERRRNELLALAKPDGVADTDELPALPAGEIVDAEFAEVEQ